MKPYDTIEIPDAEVEATALAVHQGEDHHLVVLAYHVDTREYFVVRVRLVGATPEVVDVLRTWTSTEAMAWYGERVLYDLFTLHNNKAPAVTWMSDNQAPYREAALR